VKPSQIPLLLKDKLLLCWLLILVSTILALTVCFVIGQKSTGSNTTLVKSTPPLASASSTAPYIQRIIALADTGIPAGSNLNKVRSWGNQTQELAEAAILLRQKEIGTATEHDVLLDSLSNVKYKAVPLATLTSQESLWQYRTDLLTSIMNLDQTFVSNGTLSHTGILQ